MRILAPGRLELIDALVFEADIGDITAALLEKDEHLTAALHTVFALEFEYVSLVFCGGNSLSKAYSLIERMSEDADIKVVLSEEASTWPQNKLRRYLGDQVREQVTKALESIGLTEDLALRRSLNGNQYVRSQWAYARAYDGIASLRPNLQLELVVRTPTLPTTTVMIGSLVDKLAGRTGISSSVRVIAVAETLAEKVLSFLRRFAQHRAGQMQQAWDTALVRHIYDVHRIVSHNSGVIVDSVAVFVALTQGDVQEFGYQDQLFATNPKTVLSTALRQAKDGQQPRDEYYSVLLPLVYGKDKPSFDEAWVSFESVAKQLINAL